MKLLLLLLLLVSFNAFGFSKIKVGVYNFPPFVNIESNKITGLTVDIVNQFNKIQKDFLFEVVETSSMRRFEDFDQNRFDLIMFENMHWGWKDKEIESSKVYMEGGEVFITSNDKEKTQSYFLDLKNKSIKGIHGYHYAFLNYSTDPLELKKFNFIGTTSHSENLQSVVEKRVDLAIITKEYLDLYLRSHSELKNKILASNRFDQKYQHTILVRKKSKINIKFINLLLDQMKKDGFINSLKNKMTM